MPTKDYLTVEELNYYIHHVFQEEDLLHNVPVVGEVSGCTVVNGTCYFVLKDAKAQIKIVFYNCPLENAPKNGDQVLVRGSVDYYSKAGQLNVKAYQITPFGKGILYEQLEKLRKKLESEGLFRDDHKKDIPVCPKRVAVVTSTQGAAVQDFLTTSLKKNTATDISVIDVRVQGEYCVSDIVTALTNADDYGYDVIVIARGGGSFEDLYCFNDERLVRTIYDMKTPIISAIGHETDYTLCDYVADYRAITPTAAAEKVAFDTGIIKNEILDLIEEIADLVNDTLESKIERIVRCCESIRSQANLLISEQYGTILNLTELLKIYTNAKLEKETSKFGYLTTRLEDLNPLKIIKNGYFRMVRNGETVFDTEPLQTGDEVELIGSQEKIIAKILAKETL